MRIIITFLIGLLSFSVFSQYSTMFIQDFDTVQTPVWNYSVSAGILEFVNGNSPATSLPANSPNGINGSWAWKQEGQTGGVTLVFDNVNITGYDTAIITFKVAAFAVTGSNGVDQLDHVTTAVSVNNGANWYDQVKLTGASSGNSSWPYTATGVASRVFSASAVSVFAPAAVGLAPDGPSTVIIKVPNTTNQVRLRITSRSSMNVERYCVDNVEIQIKNMKCDAGLDMFISPEDSVCSGSQPVAVKLKNYGPGTLGSVKIKWKVNNVPQPDYNWSGSLLPNATANVTLGNYSFTGGMNYNITAYTTEPNTLPDTMNLNDTIVKTGIYGKYSPGVTLSSTTINACQGDTVLITGTLTGTPPWSITINDGTANHTINNITTTQFSKAFNPSTNTTYTITSLTDATGCSFDGAPTVVVNITLAPPAAITASGNTGFCMGDSVSLMGSPGLNLTYQWKKDGTSIPGATNFVYVAKTTGAYTVVITSPIGCSATSAPVNVWAHPLPVVSLGNDTNIAPGASLLLDAGAGFNNYLWCTGAITQTIVVDSAGHGLGVQTIWAEVTDNHYCKGRDTILVNFVHNPGIAEETVRPKLIIFPNPTDGIFEIRFSLFIPEPVYVELFGHDGKRVYKQNAKVDQINQAIQIDAGRLREGIFLLRVTGNFGTITQKLIVLRR